MRRARWARPAAMFLIGAVVLTVLVIVVRGTGNNSKAALPVPTETVERRDIVVTVEATGVVEPINVVEVKSKAAGQIVRMPVDIGSTVTPGDLLVQIDTRDVKNQYDQALANLRAAEARIEVSKAQKNRADKLLAEQVITNQEHEAAVLDYANGQAQLVKARTDLDIAKQRLEDATVTAPIAGTVIDKPVSVGQVISSATSSVSGGTTLLMMADLKKTRVRALVNETDIGHVKPGQSATVVVDAYPQRTFEGFVDKIEPKATVEQSVTMFPVLVSLDNREGLLMPGMNGEVTVMVERRENVLAVPVDAVRSIREVQTAAKALGLDEKEVREQVRGLSDRTGGGPAAGGGEASPGGAAGGGGRRRRWAEAGGDSARVRGGERLSMNGPSDTAGPPRGEAGGGLAGAGGNGRGQGRVVFVKTAGGINPRLVRLGISNYDYYQVLSGLEEGEAVVLLSAAEMQRQRQEGIDRMRQRTTLPGLSRQTGGSAPAGRGGGG